MKAEFLMSAMISVDERASQEARQHAIFIQQRCIGAHSSFRSSIVSSLLNGSAYFLACASLIIHTLSRGLDLAARHARADGIASSRAVKGRPALAARIGSVTRGLNTGASIPAPGRDVLVAAPGGGDDVGLKATGWCACVVENVSSPGGVLAGLVAVQLQDNCVRSGGESSQNEEAGLAEQ